MKTILVITLSSAEHLMDEANDEISVVFAAEIPDRRNAPKNK